MSAIKVSSNKVADSIEKLVIDHVSSTYDCNENALQIELIYNALHNMLNGNFIKYNFKHESMIDLLSSNLTVDDFQMMLSKINEKQSNRKNNGVYYTPSDVTRYIITNTFINANNNENARLYSEVDAIKKLINYEKIDEIIYDKLLFDPTCGASEFLINSLSLKIEIASRKKVLIDDDYIRILKTLYGNDIDEESVEISKIRMFFEIIKFVKEEKSFNAIVQILNKNFTNQDFVNMDTNNLKKYDMVVGNPPYVEYGKMEIRPLNNYGNIYADVLKHSSMSLNDDGVLGFIVPLSYVATDRMSKIRNYIEENSKKQIVLSFADRPDCLFTGVHQKLCILFATKGKDPHQLYTSNYKHWYKAERKQLLNGCEIKLNSQTTNKFYPKIGNTIEESIYRKIFTNTEENVLNERLAGKGNQVFLNMRACFWIKAFSFNPGSKEYKSISCSSEIKGLLLCILNSSMFWLHWTIVSDCWHITSKELKHFKLTSQAVDFVKFNNLSDKLEKELERTKKYVGTKQTEYEYKHKACKETIDQIDEELATIYDITGEELDYIKNFANKYRTGGCE